MQDAPDAEDTLEPQSYTAQVAPPPPPQTDPGQKCRI